MFVEFKGVVYNEYREIVSNSIIQKEMPYGLDVRLYVEGERWVRIKNETLIITNIK
jgi:hypothetical protein